MHLEMCSVHKEKEITLLKNVATMSFDISQSVGLVSVNIDRQSVEVYTVSFE